MIEKYIVTNYDKEEFVSSIRQAFGDELKAILKHYEQQKDQDELLIRKEAARFLKISIRTLCKYQESGVLHT